MTSATQQEIYQYLVREILEEKLALNAKLPTEKELASRFHTNRMNAHFAVKRLEQQGVVTRKKRVGSFVINKPVGSELDRGRPQVMRKKVHLLASLAKSRRIHWRESTIRELEAVLNGNGIVLNHQELPAKATRAELEAVLTNITMDNSLALVLLPDQDETDLFLENTALLRQHCADICILDRGDVAMDAWPFNMVRYNLIDEGLKAAAQVCGLTYPKVLVCYGVADTKHWLAERKQGIEIGFKRFSSNGKTLEFRQFALKEVGQNVAPLLRAHPGQYAVIAGNDHFAADIVDEAGKVGLTRPRDYYLLSFDNNPAFWQYNLTTIAPPVDSIGEVIGNLILNRHYRKSSEEIVSIKIPSKLIER